MTGNSAAPLSRPRTVVLAFIFLAVLVTGAWMLQRGTAGSVIPPVRGNLLFDQVRTYIEERYLDTVSDSQAYHLAITGAIQELGDPYSAFLSPERYDHLTERTSGNYTGIGLDVDVQDGFAFVVNPLPGGPAERAGILTGDRIVEIDGKSVRYWTPDEVQRLLRGTPGSTVRVTIEHPGSATTTTLALSRVVLHQSAVRRAAILPGNVGYIVLQVFSDSTERELRTAVDSLTKSGATSLMIDVRGNPGGLLLQGVHVSDLFLDAGKRIVSTRGRLPSDSHDYFDSLPQRWPKLPIAILVDEKTASAAELFSGALQDHDRAALFGIPTYGKGSAQTVFPLGESGALKLTTALWYTPSGRSIASLDLTPETHETDRPKYKTDNGRVVLGGGGITPDMAVGDSVIPPEHIAFLRALGKQVSTFRDVLKTYALSLKGSSAVTTPAFVVTQPMLDSLYMQMQRRRIDLPRSVYDDAKSFVTRLVAYEIDRDLFGQNAEFLRKVGDDAVIRAALNIMRDVKSQSDVFERISQAEKDRRALAP